MIARHCRPLLRQLCRAAPATHLMPARAFADNAQVSDCLYAQPDVYVYAHLCVPRAGVVHGVISAVKLLVAYAQNSHFDGGIWPVCCMYHAAAAKVECGTTPISSY